jgi:hypothetical protein
MDKKNFFASENTCLPWPVSPVVPGLLYGAGRQAFGENYQIVHVLEWQQEINPDLTLLVSKVSEAGGTFDDFIQNQPDTRLLVNGGFSHYRKDFYRWPHQAFNVGDPVGLVKIRHHFFEDRLTPDLYGFLTQKNKGEEWMIVTEEDVDRNAKYILGCTPLLIQKGLPLQVPESFLQPVPSGTVNPPSVLGHGLERHPRTAVGTKDRTVVFVTIEGQGGGGCTLLELQGLGLSLGLDAFLNLDGGGSSRFRLITENGPIESGVEPEDKERILGHVLVLFDRSLR